MANAHRSAELLELADRVRYLHGRGVLGVTKEEGDHIVAALRLAAKPDEDGVREATIEKCAKVCDGIEKAAEIRANGLPSQSPGQDAAYDKAAAANTCAQVIRALSTTATPKP